MATLKYSGVVVEYSGDGWAEFKKWLDGTYASLPYVWVDEGAAYNIAAMDGVVVRACGINKTVAAEFEASYKTYGTAFSGASDATLKGIRDAQGIKRIADPVAVTDNGGSLTVDGPLTDVQLRAAAVSVSVTGSVPSALANILHTSEVAIASRSETVFSGISYTVPTGKSFYLSYFGGSAFAPLPVMFRLKVAGSSKFMVLSGSQHGGTGNIALPMAILLATAGQAITVTYEAQTTNGTVWAGFVGYEV